MKNFKSRFFEDYFIGDEINHSVPRTITEGDVALYLATTGSRFALNYSKEFSKSLGFNETPVDDILMFHLVFGRTVPDLSLNAIAGEGLGNDLDPDLLFIGFSAMDWIIHDYGPFSQEVMDACLKLDKYLGTFINRLDAIVGLDNVLFVLTADHGGLPLPEYGVEKGGIGGRINDAHFREA